MKKICRVLHRFIHPPGWVLVLLPPVTFAALIYVLLNDDTNSLPTYMIYYMSAYSLTIWVVPLPRLYRKIKKAVLRMLTATPFGCKYVGDLAFRGSVSIYQGMAANFLYVGFRIIVGISCTSPWYISVTVYYFLLGVMRLFLILNYQKGCESFELRCYRQTAWMLILLNIPMGGMIVLMVLTDSGYFYPGYVIYLSAMYTFYTFAVSVINIVRFRKLGSPVLSAAKDLNFVAALMSLLGLQTAMISQFSPERNNFRILMNAVTGGVVWCTVILIAVYMLFHSRTMKRGEFP